MGVFGTKQQATDTVNDASFSSQRRNEKGRDADAGLSSQNTLMSMLQPLFAL